MEQSPIVGYLKVTVFALLVIVIWISVLQGDKTEDKVNVLDSSVHQLDGRVRELSSDLRESRSHLDRLAGANETLMRLIAAGGARAPAPTNGGGTDGGGAPNVPDLTAGNPKGWGWKLNDRLDATLDPSRPVGTPGRYKNFLKLDPYGDEAQQKPSNTNGILNRPWASEPKGFNFLIENYATLTALVEEYCLSRPGRRHKLEPSNFNWKPVLAWRVEVSPDFKEYTIFLRHDAYWHPVQLDTRVYPHLAGKHPVTADDFKFTYDIILDTQSNVAHDRAYYKDLKSVSVIDPYTYVMRWKQRAFDSIEYSIRGRVMPKFVYGYDEAGQAYPKETVAQEFNEHWYDQKRVGVVGCGPYRFVKYEQGKYIELERWDDWFGFKEERLYPIKTLHYRIYNQGETQMNWLRAGELDLGGLNATNYREWVLEETDPNSPFKDGRIITEKAPTTSYLYIAWKNSDPMFADKRTRQALTYACNRQEICKKIWLDRYQPMSQNVFPSSKEADPNLKPYPFDLERAKQLLDAAGWRMNHDTGLREKVIDGKKTPFSFKLHWPGPSAEFQNMLDHYKNDLLKIGIQMEPLSLQWTQFQKDMRDRKFKAFSLLWVLDGWHHDFKQIWHSRQIKEPGSSNYIEFANPEVDRLQDQLDLTIDPEKRIPLVRRIARILHEEQPYTFFGWRYVFLCHWNHVKNWENHLYRIRPLLRTFPLWVER